MNKKLIIVIASLLILILIIFGIIKLTTKPATFEEKNIIKLSSKSYCGDGYCGINENCKNCYKDCSCANDEYCSKYNVCLKKEVCGDDICTAKERQERNCCIDCIEICQNNELCNEYTKKCVAKIELSQNLIDNIIKKYTELNYTLLRIDDIYYADIAVKEIILDCTHPEDEVKCRVQVIVSKDGAILKEGSYSY